MLITRWQELCPNGSFGLPHRKSFLQIELGKTNRSDKLRELNMKFNTPTARIWAGAALCSLLLSAPACRKSNPDGGGDSGSPESTMPPALIAPELGTNAIQSLPGGVYQSQAKSPIHWQPWTKETMERAREARRLLLCVIALPQQSGFVETLDEFSRDASTVETINSCYVPVLIDADASREMGLLTADLCAEIRKPLNLPLLLWMTHEGNPVAWIPAPPSNRGNVISLFQQSHSMVFPMWQDSWAYVLKNSALDNENRRKRLDSRRVSRVTSNQPATDVVRSLRQLASLYDPYSRSFDETGGLFPASSLQLLAMASTHPGLPPEVRRACKDTTRELLKDLLPSPMFDPLDGGVFLSKRGPSWSLPAFNRDCSGQARVAEALLEAYRATGDALALERALGVIAFAERQYQTENGLFSTGFSPPVDAEKWMWSVEDIEKILAPEDVAWWIKTTAMKGLGNLPSEADPRRDYFRCNTIGLSKSMAEIAKEEGLSPEAFKPRFQAAIAKLKAARDSRLGSLPRDSTAHAGASLRMVSAYVAAFSITGDTVYRDKALALLTKSREVFFKGPAILVFGLELPPSIGNGRAFLYGLALQATLDVAAVTADEQWLVWAEDLATTAAEKFASKGFLKECPDEANIIDLPVTDLLMLFDDSTAGLVSNAEFRLAALGRPLVPSFSELATPLPTYVLERPVLHTDLLIATVGRHFPVTVIRGADLSPELQLATEQLSPRMIHRRAATPDDQVPAGSVKVVAGDQSSVIASAKDLFQAVKTPDR